MGGTYFESAQQAERDEDAVPGVHDEEDERRENGGEDSDDDGAGKDDAVGSDPDDG